MAQICKMSPYCVEEGGGGAQDCKQSFNCIKQASTVEKKLVLQLLLLKIHERKKLSFLIDYKVNYFLMYCILVVILK